MKNVLFGLIGLLVGVVITGSIATSAVNTNNQKVVQMMGMHPTNQMTMNKGDMTKALQGKTGDDFDKAFLSMMIAHHQGGIDMANLAQKNAKHDALKGLAESIVAAQGSEIDEMQRWQQGWYSTPSQSPMHMMQ
ncbi:MAG TPA: DUF305 domain-containing protein [Candidatus Bathyarchaeia archaeon]|nr:DUF305 domain-containing protein [Candidatus Bathyarchaeia archaeon]